MKCARTVPYTTLSWLRAIRPSLAVENRAKRGPRSKYFYLNSYHDRFGCKDQKQEKRDIECKAEISTIFLVNFF